VGEVAARPEVLLSGLNFPEAPRWHDGRLWFSDVRARRVMSVDETGDARVEVRLDTEPSGLGFLPDGDLLVVTVNDQRVLRVSGGRVSVHAELRGLPGIGERDFLNDMVVDADGVAYVGTRVPNAGPVPPPPSDVLVRITPAGVATVVEGGLGGTNGMVLLDGELVLAETNARRLSTRTVGADGAFGATSDYGDVEGAFPDGITVDDEGGVWVASVFTGPFVRVARGGAVTDTIHPAVGEAVACELGGADGRTLFLLCADAAALRRAWSEEQGTFVPVAGPEPIDSGTIQTVRVAVTRHRDSPR
jgi:sugar lactone lactonase YvrE